MPSKKSKGRIYVSNHKKKKPYKGLSFMALPPEVRLIIYGYLKEDRVSNKAYPLFARCPKERPYRYSQPGDRTNVERCRPSFSTPSTFPLSVLSLNKTIFAEASDLFYKNMNWHFFVARTRDGYRTQPLPVLTSPPVTQYIRHITLNLIFSSPTSDCRTICDLEILAQTLAALPALKRIDLRIHKLYGSFRFFRADNSVLESLKLLPQPETGGVQWRLVSPVTLYGASEQWDLQRVLPSHTDRMMHHENTIFRESLRKMLNVVVPLEVEGPPAFYPDWVTAQTGGPW